MPENTPLRKRPRMPVATKGTWRKVAVVNVMLVIASVVLFDLATYLFLPHRYDVAFNDYRHPPILGDPGMVVWTKHYYAADESKGFDIGPNRISQRWIDGVLYPIWSNSIGCFDREHSTYASYVYFAGDSFTWGYAPYESKFGTLIERVTGTEILKAGVEHTGQRHQFAKFLEILQRTSSVPKAVFVFHYDNDIANDYAHPHSTVVDGWLTDNVSINDRNELIHHSNEELRSRLQAMLVQDRQLALTRSQQPVRAWFAAKTFLKRYSLTANLMNAARSAVKAARAATSVNTAAAATPISFYALPYEKSNGGYWYLDSPFARPNQAALLAFRDWASQHHVPLVVVLIPHKRSRFIPDWYAEMHQFLQQHQIRFLDLAGPFVAMRLDPSTLYWRNDLHLNIHGNEMVARVLLDTFPEFFPALHAAPHDVPAESRDSLDHVSEKR